MLFEDTFGKVGSVAPPGPKQLKPTKKRTTAIRHNSPGFPPRQCKGGSEAFGSFPTILLIIVVILFDFIPALTT